MKLAEDEKLRKKQEIDVMRRGFKKMKDKNAELPTYLQLPPQDFIIDPSLKEEFQAETQEKINLLHREKAWESERQSIALHKIKKAFTDIIECRRVIVHTFGGEHDVASYRSTKLTKDFHDLCAENLRQMEKKERKGAAGNARKTSQGSRGGNRKVSEMPTQGQVDSLLVPPPKAQQQLSQKLEGKVAKAIEKAEQRKMKRLNRQKEWEELHKNQPDENYEDPADVQLIKNAERNIGDFKLKTASDYVVPEEQRVNAEKKRAQLLELKKWTHDQRKLFNDRLLAMRDKKMVIIDELKQVTKELVTVQEKLPDSEHVYIPPVPEMHPDEMPERKFEYTTETLMDFRKNVLGISEPMLTEAEKGGSNEPSSRKGDGIVRRPSASIMSTLSSTNAPGDGTMTPTTILEEEGKEELESPRSSEEKDIMEEEIIRLSCKRDMLLQEIYDKKMMFDAELRILRHDKAHFDVKLKNADLREITLFEELILLKEFEKRENALAGKVSAKYQEKDDMEDKVEECRNSLEQKKEELDKLAVRENSLQHAFVAVLGENNKFEQFLTKVYKKKIKRTKKKSNDEEGGSDEDSDEESSDDDDYDSDEDDESDEDELDDSVCPQGCDQATFDQVCQLREKKLDLEEAIVEEKKVHDVLKKELDALTKKVKIIDNGLKSAKSDLEAFQREKQQKLNELDVVVTL